MQNAQIKIPFLFALLIFTINGIRAEHVHDELRLADSLFSEKKFTQSLERYERLLGQGYESPAMLLRMAYIEEGLQHYAYALYYLNRYYHLQPDEKVWQKIAALAAQQNVKGYEWTFYEHALTIYQVNRWNWVVVNMVIALLLTLLIWFVRNKPVKRFAFFLHSIIIVLLLVQLNIPLPRYAIVAQDSIPVMRGPSAGADVLGLIGSGNRLRVVGSADTWVKVRDQNQTGYIRSANLLML